MTDDAGSREFKLLVDDLYRRQATGRGVLSLELDEGLVSALLETGARGQRDAEVSDVKLELFDDAAQFSCRIRVKPQAWPPRPPIDTSLELAVRDITASEAGDSGAVLFRVEKPLAFSSRFAEVMAGLLGKLARNMPVSIDALRHKDALVTVDFAELAAAMAPRFAAQARQVRLHGLKVGPGRVRAELGLLRR
jgi:hypothetical protein